MSTVDLTAEETFESLTGFDEIAIAQHFGHTVTELATADPSMFVRALVFVVKRRDGANDNDARHAALSLTMKEFGSFFAEDGDDESGKDAPPAEPSVEQPANSLSSVS